MKYQKSLTYGMSLECSLRPYKKVTNNGYIIETQDECLIQQLIEDDKQRTATPIDWQMFKVGETILIDNRGIMYACTMNNNRQWIRLDKIIK